MLIVGLTGGIACGKTTVGGLLRNVAPDIPIIDQDIIAREVVEPGKPAYRAIIKHFGPEILFPEGNENVGHIDRKKLGTIVFNNPGERKVLSGITRWPIIQETLRQILKYWISGHSIVIIDSPLLFESGLSKLTGFNVVVWIPTHQQLQRLTQRDNAGEEDAKARIASQMPVDKKKNLADFVVDNSGSLVQTSMEIKNLVGMIRLESKRGLVRRITNRDTLLVLLAAFAIATAYYFKSWIL